MLLDCFTCPYKVVQYNEHLFNNQNKETELLSGTKIQPNLKAFSGIEEVLENTMEEPFSVNLMTKLRHKLGYNHEYFA